MKFLCPKCRFLEQILINSKYYILIEENDFPIITCFRCEWKTSKFGADESSAFLDNVKFTPGKCGYLCPTGYVN